MKVRTEIESTAYRSDKTLVVESTNDSDRVTLTLDGAYIEVMRTELEQALEPHFFNAAAEVQADEE